MWDRYIMKKHEHEAVSILDSLLDWLVEIGTFAPDLPGLERAKGMVAKARELIVLENEEWTKGYKNISKK